MEKVLRNAAAHRRVDTATMRNLRASEQPHTGSTLMSTPPTITLHSSDDSRTDHSPGRRDVLIGLGVIITVLATHKRLGDLPLRSLLKDQLQVGPETMADFFAIASIAWYVRPLAGLLTDHWPLFGTRRYHYLLLSGLAGALCWFALALFSESYAAALLATTALGGAAIFAHTVIGGVLVNEGRRHGRAEPLSALRVASISGAGLIAGPIGGFLASRAFGLACGVGATLMLSLSLMTWLSRRDGVLERRATVAPSPLRRRLAPELRQWAFWSVVALSFLFYAAPGINSVLYFHQRDALGLSDAQIGALGAINGGAGILAAAIYMKFRPQVDVRWRLSRGILLYALSSLLYLAYRSLPLAFVVEAANGFVGTLGLLSIQALAVRASPRGSEAMGYAILIGLSNLGISLSDMLGTRLAAYFRLSFVELVTLSATASAATALAVVLLPRNGPDGHPLGSTAQGTK